MLTFEKKNNSDTDRKKENILKIITIKKNILLNDLVNCAKNQKIFP